MLLFKFLPKSRNDIDSAHHLLLFNLLCQLVYEAKVEGEDIAKVRGGEMVSDSDLVIGSAVADISLVRGKMNTKNLFGNR